MKQSNLVNNCCKQSNHCSHSSNRRVRPERRTSTRSSAKGEVLQIVTTVPPKPWLEVETSLGIGRLLYSVKGGQWVVLAGTKGYKAEIEVKEIEETSNDNQ